MVWRIFPRQTGDLMLSPHVMSSPSGTQSRLHLPWFRLPEVWRRREWSPAQVESTGAFARAQLTGSRLAHFLVLVCGGALVALLHMLEQWGLITPRGMPEILVGAGITTLLMAAYLSLYGEHFVVRIFGILVYMPLLGFLLASAATEPVAYAERISLFLLFPLISITLTIRLAGVVAIALATGTFLAYHASAHHLPAPELLWLHAGLAVVFGAVLRHFRMRLAMHSHLHRLELQTRVRTDPLTGLHNRSGWNELAPQILSEANRRNRLVFVLFLDIDRFKLVNDFYGHAAGDDVLKALSGLLTRIRPVRSVAARLGGEEFVIAASIPTAGEIAEFAERIRARFADLEAKRGITVSIGVAQLRAGETLGTVMKRADEALYVAKQGGRNRVAWAPEVG